MSVYILRRLPFISFSGNRLCTIVCALSLTPPITSSPHDSYDFMKRSSLRCEIGIGHVNVLAGAIKNQSNSHCRRSTIITTTT